LPCWFGQQPLVGIAVDDFIIHDQMAACINCRLNVVAAVKSILAVHPAGFGVGGEQLRLAAVFQLGQIFNVFLLALLKLCNCRFDCIGIGSVFRICFVFFIQLWRAFALY